MGALAFTFAACEDGPSEVPVQSNPQGPVLEAGSVVTVAAGPITTGSLNITDATGQVEIATVQSVDSVLSDATVSFGFDYASKSDFSDAIEIPVTMDGTTAYVNSDDLETAHIALFGKSPKAQTVYYRIPVYVEQNGVDYRWGGIDYYCAEGSYSETIPVTLVIEDAYYLLGGATTWTLSEATAYKFDHSDANVYDDPVFTYTVDVPDDQCYWKIAPQSAIDNDSWDNVIGVATDGDTSLEGILVDENANAGRFPEAGTYKITINMEEMTYSMKLYTAPMYLCTPGGYNGWNQTASSWVPLRESDGTYQGAIMASSEFKLTDGNTWDDDKTWGLGDGEGSLSQPGTGNIPVPEDGLQWINANLDNLTYVLTHITSVGIVGGFSDANWTIDSYYEMTPNADYSVWTWTGDLEGTEWKIAFNNSWSYNYGGSVDNPTFDGSNISGYSGTHTVTFDCSGNYPVIKVE